jgi:hypothetical protein
VPNGVVGLGAAGVTPAGQPPRTAALQARRRELDSGKLQDWPIDELRKVSDVTFILPLESRG